MPAMANWTAMLWLLWITAPSFAAGSLVEIDDTQPTVLITGANRGLGLEFARQYAELGWNVIAS